MTDWNHATLEDLPGRIWAELEVALAEAAHPLRFAALGTLSANGPAVRTVVLREVNRDNRRLVFHTDVRSPKLGQLRQQPRSTWLFYHPEPRIQIRADTVARIHHADEIALRGWEQTPIVNRVNYCSIHPPGTELDDEAESLPPGLKSGPPDLQNTASGQKNFAVVQATVERFDWLRLSPERHRRAAFQWDGKHFQGKWLTP